MSVRRALRTAGVFGIGATLTCGYTWVQYEAWRRIPYNEGHAVGVLLCVAMAGATVLATYGAWMDD